MERPVQQVRRKEPAALAELQQEQQVVRAALAEPVQLELQAQRQEQVQRAGRGEQLAHPLSLELAEPRAQQLAPEEALQGRR